MHSRDTKEITDPLRRKIAALFGSLTRELANAKHLTEGAPTNLVSQLSCYYSESLECVSKMRE